jgi:hypothetical protein
MISAGQGLFIHVVNDIHSGREKPRVIAPPALVLTASENCSSHSSRGNPARVGMDSASSELDGSHLAGSGSTIFVTRGE